MNGRLVLVIEDNPMNMKLIRILLRMNNCEVIEADNAEDGIELAKRNRPDLIFMDIQLPGMDGYTATRAIRRHEALRRIPVVALTAHAMAGDEKKALEAGCDSYITKPIDTRTFPKLLESFLERGESIRRPLKGTQAKSLILIMDDSPVDAKMLAHQLPSENYEIRTATGGKEGLQMVAAEPPDLILVDVMMPEMDGYEVTEKLKRDSKSMDIPVILVTAREGVEDKIRGAEAGADEFLNKPVNRAELLSRIRSLLTLKQYKEQLINRRRLQNSFFTPSPSEVMSRQRKKPPTVLLIEDSERDARLIQSHLDGMNLNLEWVGSAEEALSLVSKKSVDAILLDLLLPGMDGFALCHRLKGEFTNIQILVTTCLKDLESRIKGIEHGADDFLIEPINRDELRARIHAALRRKAYMDRLISDIAPELSAAIKDKLTGLYNHSYFKQFLEIELKRLNRKRNSLSLILIDIDGHKELNETWGEKIKDEVLKEIGCVIRRSIRSIDLAARCDGGEFAIVLPYTDCNEAGKVAERIRRNISEIPFRNGEFLLPYNPTVSLGIAACPLRGDSMEALMKAANEALRLAKPGGMNRLGIPGDTLEDEVPLERLWREGIQA